MNPNQLQAAALQTILSDNPISRPLWADSIEILVSGILALLLILLVYRAPIWASGLGFVVLCVGQAGLTFYIWNKFYILLDLSYSLILYIISFASTSFNNFYKQFALRQLIKKQFETYLDPRQVALLQKDPSRLKLGGERKEMTFLFMDIVGFTPISEHYKNNNDPEGLVLIINNYLDRMTKIILKNGGTIDKYMGDCIMAFWNAPLDVEDQERKATECALEMRVALEELNNALRNEGSPEINTGVGINTGPCVVGNMGSSSRFDYSVLGDAVNLAARLESSCKTYDTDLIISEYSMVDGFDYKFLDEVTVKGKSEPVKIYTIEK